MRYEIEIMKADGKVTTKGDIMADAYESLIVAKDDTRGAAKVSLGYGQSADYAKEKYHIQVSLSCDQNEATILKATRLAISTVQQLNETVQKEMLG